MNRIAQWSGVLLGLSLAVLASGCGSSSRGGDGEADVILRVEVDQESPMATMVDCANFVLPTKTFVVRAEFRAPDNPGNSGGVPGTADVYTDVVVTRYCIKYTAYDGGNVAYKDVPAPFCLELGGSVIDTPGEVQVALVPVALTGVCNQPPCNGDPGGDPLPINTTMNVCFYGRTVAGDTVSVCTDLYTLFCNSNEGNCL